MQLDEKGKPLKFQHITYGKGFAIKVNPPERAHEVMHYLITGHLLAGKSLDGVTWEQVDNPQATQAIERAGNALRRSMEISKHHHDANNSEQNKP